LTFCKSSHSHYC